MVRMARWPEDRPAPTLPSFRPQIVSGTNVNGSHAYTLQSTFTRSATCSAKPADNKDSVHSLNTSKKYCPTSSENNYDTFTMRRKGKITCRIMRNVGKSKFTHHQI